jgi:hypothetical protein
MRLEADLWARGHVPDSIDDTDTIAMLRAGAAAMDALRESEKARVDLEISEGALRRRLILAEERERTLEEILDAHAEVYSLLDSHESRYDVAYVKLTRLVRHALAARRQGGIGE